MNSILRALVIGSVNVLGSGLFLVLLVSGSSKAIASELDSTDPMTDINAVADLATEVGLSPAQGISDVDAIVAHPMGQITSVSQLTDVQPTDWAFQALQSLVERYGCIAGYPDGTFRGNRALTRYEFAAGLNACLDRILEIAGGELGDTDLDSIRRLQDEFAAELATLRGRVDSLEARTSQLEENQFSTTTKLQGVAQFQISGLTFDGPLLAEGVFSESAFLRTAARNSLTNQPIIEANDTPQIAMSGLIWLTFNTSFSGRDLLVTTLAAGNGQSGVNRIGSAGTFNNQALNFWEQSAGPVPGSFDFVILESFYEFPITSSLRASVGPRVNYFRYFDRNPFTSIFRGTASFSSADSALGDNIKRGAGAVLLWDISEQFSLNLAYLAENNEFLPGDIPSQSFNTATSPSKGLFGGTNSIIAELTFSPSPRSNIRFYYNHTSIERSPIAQLAPLESLHGVADDGFGGRVRSSYADIFGINFDWLITDGFGVFGRYTYANNRVLPVNPLRRNGSVEVQAIQAGLAFPDLGRRGALGTISFAMPFDILEGEEYLVSGAGDGGTQAEIEVSYFYPLSRNVVIIPSVYTVFNMNNFDSNPTVIIGNIRTQLAF